MKRVVVIGAGVGGLTTAAILSRAGFDVTVLEAHIYAGGCAGTFFHQGFRFDAGATLAGGFYPGGPMDLVAKAAGIEGWPLLSEDHDQPSIWVHLPDGQKIGRWSDSRRHAEHTRVFGTTGQKFFNWQEKAADALWALSLRNIPWPPQSMQESFELARKIFHWVKEDSIKVLPGFILDAFRSAAARLEIVPSSLRTFIDGQLLIAAQATSDRANALYSAAALDLPRRGIVHFKGGMGAIAERLVQSVQDNGGRVLYRQQVERIKMDQGRPVAVETRRGEIYTCDYLIANLTPWNIAELIEGELPKKLKRMPERPENGWGAYMIYAGIKEDIIPENFGLHHQVLGEGPLAEGNSVFLSLSPAGQPDRAPAGYRALTISTHTEFEPWWQLFEGDPAEYEKKKQEYLDRMLDLAEKVLPGIRDHSKLILPGTPVTFQRFTRRVAGWVGGFPQVNLFQAWGPSIMPGLWMVGDSIFPGQSTAAVALGGLRVAETVMKASESLSPQEMIVQGGKQPGYVQPPTLKA